MYVQDSTTDNAWRWATSSGNNAGNDGGSMAAAALDQHAAGPKVIFRRDARGHGRHHNCAQHSAVFAVPWQFG